MERAKDGDKAALEEVVRRIQDRLYGLAMRMLWHPDDAKDATQEILIKIVTNLGSFRQESAFTTWVYRIASNHLLTTRKRRAEHEELTFEKFGEQLDDGLSDEPLQIPEVEQRLLVEEVKIGCTQGMLLCLDREHRIAYILGEIFDVTSEEGAYILNVTPAAFRKRLSRARTRIRNFMRNKCGIVNPANPCRCFRRAKFAIEIGRVNPNNLLFAKHPAHTRSDDTILERVQEMEELQRSAAIFRSHPDYSVSDVFVDSIKKLIDSGKFRVFG